MKFSTITATLVLAFAAGVSNMPAAHADDIDIFIGSAGGGGTPNVMFLIDNTSNWSKAAQHWPDQPSAGQAELDAVIRIATDRYNAHLADPNKNPAINIGVALMMNPRPSSGDSGGYVRFGARDVVTNLANLKALANILGYGSATPPTPPNIPPPLTTASPATSIYAKVNDPTEKFNESSKDEGAALYELYKYFNSLDAFAGANTSVVGATSPGQAVDDYPGATLPQSAKGQGLTSGFALTANGRTYVGPSAPCSKNYVIYISNNAQRASPWPSSISYEGVSAAPIIGPTTGIGNFYQQYTREWVRFLKNHEITTYVLDAYNGQVQANGQIVGLQNAQYSKLLQLAVGPDNYYQVGSEAAIEAAVSDILVKINATSSAFAATSLPASATNRSVSENQVYLGVFRPDVAAGPRWFGNLKRYQIIMHNGGPALGDATGTHVAVNSGTGFMDNCAVSYWTADTSGYKPAAAATAAPYWSIVAAYHPDPLTDCPVPGGNSANPVGTTYWPVNSGATWSSFSDAPDGPAVEKGGAAEILRRGNIPNLSAPTWQANNRTIKTVTSGALADFSTASVANAQALGVPAAASSPTLDQLVDFIKGWDSNDENANGYIDPNAPTASTTNETRASIHGDVIHSTPRPITYNNNGNGVVVYYGSNDGMYHALNAFTGQEIWSFLAPEFYSRMYRQYANSPEIAYANLPAGIVPTPTPKDYFFDGATGVYQSADNSVTRIYPTMRRGGRMIYAFDVSATSYNSTTHLGNPPATPGFLWKAGCPNMGNNTGCTSVGGNNMNAMGQSWSTPQPAVLKDGNTALAPVVIFGGGYDSTQTTSGGVVTSTSCEDQNTQSPSCGSRTGNAVYIVDGQNGPGTLLKTFTLPNTHGTPGSVVGDISLLDVNGDGYTDYAYLADTNGFVYRIDFVDGPVTLVPQSQGSWRITQIAGVSSTANYGRKFLFGPTLFLNQNKVYLGLGTGDREHPLITQYPYTTPVLNHFYLFIDDPATTGTYVNLDGTTMQSGVGALCSTTPVLPQNTANPSATAPIGFYLPLNAHGTGEQTVTPALIIGGQVTWGTNRPLPPLANACTNGLGEARGYLVDLVNGSGALNVTGECTDTTAATSTTNQSTVYPGGGLPIPPTEAIVPVTNTPPGAGGDGGGGGGGGGDGSGANPSCTPDTCSYVNVCIGCPPKDTGTCSPSNISACDVTGVIPSARRRIYWFTPDDK